GREFAVQPELEVELRAERPERLGPQPRLPVGVGLANLLHLRAAAPARAVVVPHDLVFADVAERAAPQHLARRELIGLAAMLGADLDDEVALADGVARARHLPRHVAPRYLADDVLYHL